MLFRLDELGVPALCGLLDSQSASAMHALVSFLVDDAMLREWVVEGWCKFLDRSFVERDLLGRVGRHREGLRAWLEASTVRAFGPSSSAPALISKRPPTIPCAPRLTAPRARVPPEPTVIPVGFKANPIPTTLERTSLEALEAARIAKGEQVRNSTIIKYGPEGPTAPRLTATRSSVERVRAEVEAARTAEAGEAFRAKPPPSSYPEHGASVRLTTAALLREEAVFRAKQAAEAEVLRQYEATLRDSSGYDAWRAAQLEADARAEAALVEHRRAEAAASDAAAAAAVASVQRKKRGVAAAVKRSEKVIEEMVAVEEAGEIKLRTQVARAVKAVEFVAPAAAKEAVEEERKVEAEARRKVAAATAAALRATAERESRERAELIKQLRALERTPRPHDPTLGFNRGEVGAPGKDPDAGIWFESMSLVELRERLLMERQRVEREREWRRGCILEVKREVGEKLSAVAEGVARRRAERAQAGEARRLAARQAAAAAASAESERLERVWVAASDSVEARAAAKEAERQSKAAAERRATAISAFMGGMTEAGEERRLKDRGRAVARVSAEEQARVAKLADGEWLVREKEREAARERSIARAEVAKEEEAARRSQLALSKKEEEEALEQDRAWRKAMFFSGVDRESTLSASLAQMHPYAHQQSENARERVRGIRGEPPLAALHSHTLSKRLERLPSTHPLSGKLQSTLSSLTLNRSVVGSK